MRELLAVADHQFASVPDAQRQPGWADRLALLASACTGLDAAYATWRAECAALPATAVPGTEAYDEPLAERNAEAWSYLCDWADGGRVLNQIARAAARARGPAGPSAEHTRAQDPAALPPQPPGHPQHRGPR